jgi:uncharacterized protein YcbX
MAIELGTIEALFRYPVKSMRGEPLREAQLGWHGLEGDRRFAIRRLGDRAPFPWLTAGRLPALVCYAPKSHANDGAPTHVMTPDGRELDIHSEALAADIGEKLGAPVELMQLKHGVFDDASVSVITSDTAREICKLGGRGPDLRRFRPNVVIRSTRGVPFEEDAWISGTLAFGESDEAPRVAVTARDVRCAMINIDPDDGSLAPELMKAVVKRNDNNAGVYGTVTRAGLLRVGQRVVLHPWSEAAR